MIAGARENAPSARWECACLEGDVVAGRAGTDGCCLLEVGRVRRDVGLGREPVALRGSGALATARELARFRADRNALALVSVSRLPLAPVEGAVDRDWPALREIGR